MLASSMVRSSGFGATSVKAPREIEYDLFAQITRAMQLADLADSANLRASAVTQNTQLWTELAADLADPANGLPSELKGGLLSLALFSIRQGTKVLSQHLSMQVLIDINVNIMQGLRGTGAQ